MSAAVALLEQPDAVRLALSPMRRTLLERLRTPTSATQLASELALGRQRVNYHLRALEQAGLIELVENRQRRGCVERILVARARAFVVDPAVMMGPSPVATASATSPDAAQDRFSVEHLIGTAAAIVRDVGRMQARAHQQRTRLLTFAIDTEITFATPADLEHFAVSSPTSSRARPRGSRAPTAGDTALSSAAIPRRVSGRSLRKPSSAQTAGDSHGRTRSRLRRNPRRRTH